MIKLIKNSYYLINYEDSICSFKGIAKYVGTASRKNEGKCMHQFRRLIDTGNLLVMYFYDEDIVKKVTKEEAKEALTEALDEIKANF